jgi:hypothetical protein
MEKNNGVSGKSEKVKEWRAKMPQTEVVDK